MSPLVFSKPTTAGPEYANRAGAQDKVLKLGSYNMIEVLKDEMQKNSLRKQTNSERKSINS